MAGVVLKGANNRVETIRDYKDLQVWPKGMELAKLIYHLTQPFPREEKFGIVSPMRRATVSAPSNLAEGQARNTTGEFVQFISHAEGSLAELDTQLRLSVTLGLCMQGETYSVAPLETLQVRTARSPESMIRGVEKQIHDLAAGMPVFGVQSMEQILSSGRLSGRRGHGSPA